MTNSKWVVGDQFVTLNTPWFTLLGEHITLDNRTLDYWRIERADSIVVLPVQEQQILLPPMDYRPGIGEKTLDFPGGRCVQSSPHLNTAVQILQRELAVETTGIRAITPLNRTGWIINSSFSNQKLYGFLAELAPEAETNAAYRYPTNLEGIGSLLEALVCLQCRMVLLEFQNLRQKGGRPEQS